MPWSALAPPSPMPPGASEGKGIVEASERNLDLNFISDIEALSCNLAKEWE